MNRREKEMYVSKYSKKIYNKKDSPRFYAHVQHFLEHNQNDDEVTAEILDFMYEVLVTNSKQEDSK